MPTSVDPALSRESGNLSDEFYQNLGIFLTNEQSARQLRKCRDIGRRYGKALDKEIENLRSLGGSPDIDLAIQRALEYRRLLDRQIDGLTPKVAPPQHPVETLHS